MSGLTVRPDGSWELALQPAHLRRFPVDVLAAFVRCFVHADRLVSLSHMMALTAKEYPPESATHTRNLYTMFFFVHGTLHELADAIGTLRGVLAKAKLFSREDQSWKVLQAVHRTASHELAAAFRNNAAFHVNREFIGKGVKKLLAGQGPIVLAQGDSRLSFQTASPLGPAALFLGAELTREERLALMETTKQHQLAVASSLQELLMATLRRAGLELREHPEELAGDPRHNRPGQLGVQPGKGYAEGLELTSWDQEATRTPQGDPQSMAEPTETEEKKIAVALDVPEDYPSTYVTNLVVQHDEHDFTITFFDIRPPILFGSPEDKSRQLNAVHGMRVRPAVRLVVTASRMGEIVQVLKDNLATYERSYPRKVKE